MAHRTPPIIAILGLLGFTIGIVASTMPSRAPKLPDSTGAWNTPSPERRGGNAPLAASITGKIEAQVRSLLDRARSGEGGALVIADLQREVDRWLLADPIGCITWLHSRGATGLVSRELFPAAFTSALNGDLVVAIRLGGEIGDPVLRSAWLRSVFHAASETGPRQALELLTFLPAKMEGEIAKHVIAAWAAKDGPGAWRAAVEENRRDDDALAPAALEAWIEADPLAAEEFVRAKLANPGRGKEKELFFAALRGLESRGKTDVVLRALKGMTRDATLQSIWMNALVSAAGHGTQQALQAIEEEPPGLMRDAARAAFAQGLVKSDLDLALEIAATLPAYASRRAVYATAIVDLVKKEKPEEAAALAQRHDEPLLRAEQIAEVTSLWARKDPAAYLRFVFAQPEALAASWLDQMVGHEPADFPASKPAREHGLNPADLQRLERELSARLSAADAAILLKRLEG